MDERSEITGIRRKLRIVESACGLPPSRSTGLLDSVQASESELNRRKIELVGELMRRAMEQNPELAAEYRRLTEQQERAKEIRAQADIEQFRSWQRLQFEKRKAERHVRYDDKRNINALTGLRRSYDYKYAPRAEKIQMEIDRYYARYGIEPPRKLLEELSKLKRAKELYLKRIRRYDDGRIIRPRYAG